MQQGPFYAMRMQYSQQQLDQFPDYNEFFKGLALQWNSKLLFLDNLTKFTQLMGAFCCTIIKLSKNQQICQQYKEIYDKTIQQLDQNSELLTQIVKNIFDLNTELLGIPTTPDFEKIGKKLLESFELYKQQLDKLSQAFIWEGQVVKQQNSNTNFRIIIQQHQSAKVCLLFSTNLDTNHLYPTFQQMSKGIQQVTEIPKQFEFQQNTKAQTQFTFQQPKAFLPQQRIAATQEVMNANEVDMLSTQMANKKINVDSKTGDSQRLQTGIRIKTNKTFKCELCEVDLGEDNSILSKCCNKIFHVECYKYDLECKAKEFQDIEKITCFGCEKSLKPHYQFLIAHLETETWLLLMTIEVIKAIPNKCFKCNQPIAISNSANQIQLIQCASCNAKNCRLCKQQYHGENLKNSQCPNVHREIIKSMKGMVITICPFCNLIQTKDEKCNHVTCSQCKKDLCAICSVDRRPIMAHGNHYHREGCTDHAGWKDKNGKKVLDKYNPKCQLCQQNTNKEVCEYPKSLNEYKQEKQY